VNRGMSGYVGSSGSNGPTPAAAPERAAGTTR
jgi:hypothetical protein